MTLLGDTDLLLFVTAPIFALGKVNAFGSHDDRRLCPRSLPRLSRHLRTWRRLCRRLRLRPQPKRTREGDNGGNSEDETVEIVAAVLGTIFGVALIVTIVVIVSRSSVAGIEMRGTR